MFSAVADNLCRASAPFIHTREGETCPEAVRLIDKYIELVGEFEAKGIPRDQTFVGLPEGAARPLFGIRDEEKRQKAISHVEKALTRTTPTGGQYTKKLTKTDVEKIINNIEVHPHARGRDGKTTDKLSVVLGASTRARTRR